MKELSIEEKAKAYDEAIKRARDVYTYYCDDREQLRKIEHIFPELKESEDERIRKGIIKSILDLNSDWLELHGVTKENAIAWLENKGEISDKIVERARTEKQRILVTESDGVANIDWDTRSLQDVKLLLKYGLDYIKKLEKQDEQKPTWSEEDEDMQGRQIMEESNENRQLYSRIFRRGFKDGAKWQKERMMTICHSKR